MGKNTTFIKHTSCEPCGSSDANAVYSDGSTYCFSCKKSTASGTEDTNIEFNVVQSQLTLDEIGQLPIDTFRNISKKVLYNAGVKIEYDDKRNIVSHFYPITVNKKVKAYKKRIVATKEFRSIGKAEVPELFNQCNSGKRKNLVITEGEIDCLSILEMLTKAKAQFDVVSIVNGAQSARRNIASNLEFVNKYEKVFLAFDNDEFGIEAAKDVARSHNASIGLAVGPVRPIGTRQAVDVIVVKDDSVMAIEHVLGGGGIAMSRAAKSAIDQVRQMLLEGKS